MCVVLLHELCCKNEILSLSNKSFKEIAILRIYGYTITVEKLYDRYMEVMYTSMAKNPVMFYLSVCDF